MQTASIYKINKKGYLIFGSVKTVSGFSIATDPYIQIAEKDENDNNIANAIKSALNTDDIKRVVDPKNWKEFSKEFLKKAGVKSSKELNKATTIYCGIKKENGNIIFTPTKHAEKPDEGFINKSKDEPDIVVPATASNQDIAEALKLAFSICE